MKVEIEGNEVRIMGKNLGKKRFLLVYVNEDDGRDRFSMDTVKDNVRIGNLPVLECYKDHVIINDHGTKRFVD